MMALLRRGLGSFAAWAAIVAVAGLSYAARRRAAARNG
jgi:hypothetical protein